MKIGFKNQILQREQEIRKVQHPEEELPDSFFQDLMDDQLGRGYLNHMIPADQWEMEPPGIRSNYGWLRFDRLPIRPGKEEENTLLESWQSVLSACHTMNLSLAFVLMRRKGRSEVYLGVKSRDGRTSSTAEILRQCMGIHMPGAELRTVEDSYPLEDKLENFTSSGIVTGIPSLRSDTSGVTLQTLDKVARGIHIGGQDKDYAMVVLADPANDGEIMDLQQTFLTLKSEIHQYVGYSEGTSTTDTVNKSSGGSFGIGYLTEGLALGCQMTGNVIGARGFAAISGLFSRGRSYSTSSSVSREYRDFTAKYCEDLIDKNVTRMEQGRNLGFWQTGVYVLADDNQTIDSVLGILRSVYSGRESFVEPIRVFNTSGNSTVSNYIGQLQFLPLPGSREEKNEIGKSLGLKTGWHVLGRMYESFTTAMTTEELSIATSLPRREVPGLRMVKNAVSFANNAIPSKDSIDMGKLVDMGAPQETHYQIPVDALVRHILVCGSTGTGKSTTCKKIINGVRDHGIPVMIIEPAKDDYVRWAISENKKLPPEKQYKIIMPGVNEIDGFEPDHLWLNPFEPGAWKDSPVNLVQRAETLATLLNACLPSEDVIPVLIEEAVHECLETAAAEYNVDLTTVDNPQLPIYPTLDELKLAGQRTIARKTYEKRTKDNFAEILMTRFNYLSRGTRGSILGGPCSTSFETLFDHPVVINLSRLAGRKDKSLIMSLLLLQLQEYRTSRYEHDVEYRKAAQENKLMHLVVVEEAHNVLTKPSPMSTGSSPEQAVAELFGNMLSEIRSYGQGMMIVDQVPTRLIDDAIKNTNYKISHRLTSPDDIEVMSSAMMLRPDQAEIIPSLEIGNAIICGDMDDSAAWMKVER